MATYYHRLLHITTTIEKGDKITIVTFFIATTLQKKTTTHYHCFFLFKHKEKGNDNKLTLPYLL
jgi:hypothetical protein